MRRRASQLREEANGELWSQPCGRALQRLASPRLGALLGTLKKVHPICFEGASIIFEEGTWGDAAFALETLREQGIHLDSVYEAYGGYRSCAAPMKPDAFIEASKVSLEKHRAWLRAEAKERAEAREREDKSSK